MREPSTPFCCLSTAPAAHCCTICFNEKLPENVPLDSDSKTTWTVKTLAPGLSSICHFAQGGQCPLTALVIGHEGKVREGRKN